MFSKRLIFKGRVQGVGFRAVCKRLSESFELSGYVKNLDDGSVELVASAKDEAEFYGFLKKISHSMSKNIESVEEKDFESGVEVFSSFEIR